MSGYPREELEEMMRRWIEGNRKAEESGGKWSDHLGPFYRDDAVYRWGLGPNENFVARGRKQIEDWALGYQMEGFEEWVYPYADVIIDDKQGMVIAMWKQVAPYKRDDGGEYIINGIGGSWFKYAGDFKWESQEDFFDFGNAMALFMELAADNKLSPKVKRKIQMLAKGKLLLGHEKVRPERSLFEKLRGYTAMAKIALVGR